MNIIWFARKSPASPITLTKVWDAHTVKIDYTQNIGNLQGNDGTNPNGSISSFNGQQPNIITGIDTGSPNNPVANFVMGNVTGYTESNGSPVSDMPTRIRRSIWTIPGEYRTI